MPSLLERIFGANWRTSLSGAGVGVMGLLTALSAAPYQLGDVATVIPAQWKERLFIVSAIATFVLKLINSAQTKDRTVAGTGAPEDPYRTPDKP